ncbi:MAG: tRNA (cytidine(34)-2'-O)-methyltransferase [Candidatus Caenarcaniphilales bacterium]|nr:tRNA (cytidine(34)-2'-O)-methyltransferase [Candidatus Caenarcaniphilales bacterium]
MLNIVLFEPEIPQNTGNIGRLCVCNGLNLHLIKPLGFEISDKYLKRSGLDYWQYLKINIYENWQEFYSPRHNSQFWFLTTKAQKTLWQVKFKEDDYLVFGPESRGLPLELRANPENSLLIPMFSEDYKRSLNLSTSVGIVAYEALRQIKILS